MVLDEYYLENTKIKFYNDCIVENMDIQKEYIDSIIINLMNKIAPYNCNLSNFHI